MKEGQPIFFPSLENNYDLKQQRDKNYADAINILQTQWQEADKDQRFAMGDQDIWAQIYPNVTGFRRKTFNFNILNSIVQAISGQQRQTRKSSICIPVHNDMQKTADQLTKCLYHIHNQSGAYQVYSDAFEQGALIQGIGFISIYKDLTEDPVSGDFRLRYVDFKSVIVDPFFRRHDMSDARFYWTRQFFDRQEIIQLYPDFTDKIMGTVSGAYRDDKFYYMPEVYQIQTQNLCALDEYWYLSNREATYLVDTETNEMQEFTGDEEDMRIIYMNFGNRFKMVKKPKKTVKRQVIINDQTIIDEGNPYGIDRYPIVPVLGYMTADTAYFALKFRGVIRDARDCQFLLNRRKVADLDILESQQQGIKMKKGALVTPDDAFNAGNGRVLVVSDKAQMTDVEPMQIIPPSPVMIQMEEMLMNITYRIIGQDPSAMGIDVDDKAGIISMMRQVATARNLQRLFDQLDESQRLVGDILVELIQKNWTYNKIKMVIGEEPTPEFDNKLFFKYGCKVIQGSLTETQMQLELAQILKLQEMYPQLNLMDEVIDCMQIQNKDKIKEKLAAQAEAQQKSQEQMQQLQMQQMQVDNETKLSYARSQDGLAAERIEKIQTDKAVNYEKIKRSQEEETGAILNLIKAIKELETMDTTHIMEKMNVLHSIKDLEVKESSLNVPSGGIMDTK